LSEDALLVAQQLSGFLFIQMTNDTLVISCCLNPGLGTWLLMLRRRYLILPLMLIDVFTISGCALSSGAHFTHESFCYYDVEAVIVHGSTLSSGVAFQQKILLLMQLTVHWQWVISARWCNIWPYNPASTSVQCQWIQETATDAAEIGSQDLDVLPKYAWVAWFSLAPVLYNSQEKVGLP
jgi:hypothetical protein